MPAATNEASRGKSRRKFGSKLKTASPLEQQMRVFVFPICHGQSIRVVKSAQGDLYLPLRDLADFLGYVGVSAQYIQRRVGKTYKVTIEDTKVKISPMEECLKWMSTLRGERLERAEKLREALNPEEEKLEAGKCVILNEALIKRELVELHALLGEIGLNFSRMTSFLEASPLMSFIRQERAEAFQHGMQRANEAIQQAVVPPVEISDAEACLRGG